MFDTQYISTVYGIVPAATWRAYRTAQDTIVDAAEWHRQVRIAEARATDDVITDIVPTAF